MAGLRARLRAVRLVLGLRQRPTTPSPTDAAASTERDPATPVPIPSPKRQGRIRDGDDGFDGLLTGVALSTPRIFHHTLGLINLPYYRLGPVPGIFPLSIGRPQELPKIFPLPQQGIEPPFHLHGYIFLLPPDLLVVPICAQFSDLGLVAGGSNIGPKLFPCLLQLTVRPLPEVPLTPFPNPLHILPCTLLHKPQLPPPLYIFILKILPLLASSSLGDLSAIFAMTIILYPKPPFSSSGFA